MTDHLPPPPPPDRGRRAERKAEKQAAKAAEKARPEWQRKKLSIPMKVKVRDGQIHHHKDRWSIIGASARVETAGEISSRFTATRLALIGPFALAFKKKKDNRELYLTVEGPEFAFVEPIDPSLGAVARRFAADLTSLGRQAALDTATPEPVPVADELAKLADLHSQGLLSLDEFTAAKARLLG